METIDYTIFPFTFKHISNEKVLLVNIAGEFLIIEEEYFNSFLNRDLKSESDTFYNLESKQFLAREDVELAVNLLAVKLRTRKLFLREFTSLHMIVLTCGCNCKCVYCQTSSLAPDESKIHMTRETAAKVVETIFQTPSPEIKIEFQGGEPTLNWDVLTFVVKYAEKINNKYTKKKLSFVVCTNLISISDKMIKFFKKHHIMISTSLDGPRHLHELYRICRDGSSSYSHFIENLGRVREFLGKDSCSPLLTITKHHLTHLREIVDEYINLGFDGIFLRPVNPYGFAVEEWEKIACSIDDFIDAYKEILDYIIQINRKGLYFPEYYSMLLLTRILTPFSTGFVDLQSPTGAGISGVIYDYDGNVYPTDEGRMLARAGNKIFLLGNVHSNTYYEIFGSTVLRKLVSKSCLEILPGCNYCVYQSYCGSDPIRYYVECGDIMGHRPTSDFCKKNMAIFDHIFSLIINDDTNIMNVFWSWITGRDLKEIENE
jgi:uncharacterized protein